LEVILDQIKKLFLLLATTLAGINLNDTIIGGRMYTLASGRVGDGWTFFRWLKPLPKLILKVGQYLVCVKDRLRT
jgi:hypothetical protein